MEIINSGSLTSGSPNLNCVARKRQLVQLLFIHRAAFKFLFCFAYLLGSFVRSFISLFIYSFIIYLLRNCRAGVIRVVSCAAANMSTQPRGPRALLAALLGQVANYCRHRASEFKSHRRPRFCLSIQQQPHLAGHQLTSSGFRGPQRHTNSLLIAKRQNAISHTLPLKYLLSIRSKCFSIPPPSPFFFNSVSAHVFALDGGLPSASARQHLPELACN